MRTARVARLATTDSDGRPHLVPIVFVLDGEKLYSAVDAKPKRSRRLRRVANARERPDVTVLVGHYGDDWSRLWWAPASAPSWSGRGGSSRSQRRDVTVFSSPAPSTPCLSLCLVGCPIPFAGMPWHRKPGFKLVAVKDVRRLTGFELSELLSRQNIQRLTRIDESGAREEFVRVPVELLIEEPAD